MLPVTLSWDLFIVVFFAVGMSFVFIVGTDQAIRGIIGAYIGIIAVHGVEIVAGRLLQTAGMGATLGTATDPSLLSLGKIFLFGIFLIIFFLRSGITLSHDKDPGKVLALVITGLLGFALCGLIVSTLLLYGVGSGILGSATQTATFLTPYLAGSTLVELLVVNQNIWFTLPAFLIVAVGLMPGE